MHHIHVDYLNLMSPSIILIQRLLAFVRIEITTTNSNNCGGGTANKTMHTQTCSLSLLVHGFTDGSPHLVSRSTALVLLVLVWIQRNHFPANTSCLFNLEEGEENV